VGEIMKNIKICVLSVCLLLVVTIIFSTSGIANVCNNESSYRNKLIVKGNNDNGMWTIDVVDGIGEVGWYTDIVVNSETVFISYYDIGREDLKLASLDNNGWSWEVVDSEGKVGMYSSIAIDSSGNLHISYYDETNQDLKYAHRTGMDWNIEVIDAVGDVGLDTSIAVDSNDFPHISYLDDTNRDLKYATWTGSQWNIETIDVGGDVGLGSSITIDSNNNPHISYTDLQGYELFYTFFSEPNWHIEVADADSRIYGLTSIALDSNQHPHIAYYDSGTPVEHINLKYAYKTNDDWNIEIVDPDVRNWWQETGVSIAIDQFGRVHIAYYDWKSYDLNYAWRVNNRWNIETADPDGVVGAYASLDLDSNGYPHISYMDRKNLDLKYAKKLQYSPEAPDKPSGRTKVKPGEDCFYESYTNDFEKDKIRYGWDWGDHSDIQWTDYYTSGATVEASHAWGEKGTHQIRVIAEDENGHRSSWSEPLTISVSKNKKTINNYLLKLLGRFPLLQKFLKPFEPDEKYNDDTEYWALLVAVGVYKNHPGQDRHIVC